ncbi:ATP-binding protein [uncultured Mitsuokella sp.]|uniref:ATP-binding protein n=1 Tax=uncultured Mitsuokella sp. TaxID=453120 RepID=UPI00261A3DC6|nr:ATP-binding protein [uncultured Mitsuokella sp.]
MTYGKDLSSLTVCRSLLDTPVFRMLKRVLEGDETAVGACAAALMREAERLGMAGSLVRGAVIHGLVQEANLVSETIEAKKGALGESLRAAFVRDIEVLLPLITEPAHMWLGIPFFDDYKPTHGMGTEAAKSLTESLAGVQTAEEAAAAFLAYYRRYGYGDIASCAALEWEDAAHRLRGIPSFAAMDLADIIGYAHQKEQILGNTEAFVAGRTANNVLLVGARGTGKSSIVKALAKVYYGQGLRLVQLKKSQLSDLPAVMEALRIHAGKRFIVFLDDLSFEEHDPAYKCLKSAIEGGVAARPENVLLYATSNRRHLIHESWRDRDGAQDELYREDSMNETISLSDRFGLIIHYYAPDQKEYLSIIDHMLRKEGIALTPEELRIAGVRWEMTHSGRSGRTAQQFVMHYLGQNTLY